MLSTFYRIHWCKHLVAQQATCNNLTYSLPKVVEKKQRHFFVCNECMCVCKPQKQLRQTCHSFSRKPVVGCDLRRSVRQMTSIDCPATTRILKRASQWAGNTFICSKLLARELRTERIQKCIKVCTLPTICLYLPESLYISMYVWECKWMCICDGWSLTNATQLTPYYVGASKRWSRMQKRNKKGKEKKYKYK